ncbi:hypothetical protein [Chroococcidiopsis sp. CCNUC1]|uniref:hypothetical protein n=1 Tax=Chroococcidiopsis sp. CCNUC1 TaxID=2653189 RepID=UPI002021B7C2|nr:hypothetical protein [Chroococcidiopsis sp. CCNUC1]URD49728.1 hypothetical protein M5J74_25880 [Chroococcidiopsis sp. CCNUC1]
MRERSSRGVAERKVAEGLQEQLPTTNYQFPTPYTLHPLRLTPYTLSLLITDNWSLTRPSLCVTH